MGGKGRRMWGSTLKEGHGASVPNKILGGEVRDKKEVQGIEGSTGMWNEIKLDHRRP